MNDKFEPGLYRHFKGGIYRALMLCETHEGNGDRDVVYVSLANGKAYTRPYRRDSRDADSWCDLVLGGTQPRFYPYEFKVPAEVT